MAGKTYKPETEFSTTNVEEQGKKIDVELANIQSTLAEVQTAQSAIQRDDKKLANKSVSLESLDDSVKGLYLSQKDYEHTGGWTAGKDYQYRQSVVFEGVVYGCLEAHKSYDFDLDKSRWVLLDGLKASDVGKESEQIPRNSDLPYVVGGLLPELEVKSKGTTTPRKIEERLADEICLLDEGVLADGVSDDTAAFIAASNKHASVEFTLPKTHVLSLSSRVNLKSNQTYNGNGGLVNITNSGAGLGAEGTVGDEIPLAVAITEAGTTEITMSAAHGLVRGDLAFIQSSINCLSDDAGEMRLGYDANYKSFFAEFVQVSSVVSATTVRVFGGTRFGVYPLNAGVNSGSRTSSTLRKVNAVENVTLKDFTYIHNFIGDTNKSEFLWAAYCVVADVHVDHLTESGGAVEFIKSYGCEAIRCKATHSMEDFNYLGSGVGYNYYTHNDFVVRGGHNCRFIECESTNGTQCFDITFSTSVDDTNTPSVDTIISGWKTYNAQVNPVTSHDGSIGSTIANGVAKNSSRGVSLRSRDEIFTNNDIGISPADQSKFPSSNKYGIAVADGFTLGTVVDGNTVRNARRGLSWGKATGGFNKMDLTISKNTFVECGDGITINKVNTHESHVNTVDANLTIKDNDFVNLSGRMVYIGEYTSGVSIIGNTSSGDSSVNSSEWINIKANCQDILISDNKAPKGVGAVPLVRTESLTDVTTYPSETIHNLNIFDNFDGSNTYDVRYDGSSIPPTFGPSIPNTKSRTTITTFGDIDVSHASVVILDGDGVINNILGLGDSETVLLKKNSNGNNITFTETGNITLHSGSSYAPLSGSTLIQATRINASIYVSPLTE
jgi:hypothetical protein